MNTLKSILSIGRDEALQKTRTILLQQAGYRVSAANNDDEAIRYIEYSSSFDLVLVCHSVPEKSRAYLITRMKSLYPKMPILTWSNGYDMPLAQIDGVLHSLESPVAFLNKVDSLTKRARDEDLAHVS